MERREKYLARLMNDPAKAGISEIKFIHTPQVMTARAVRLRCQYACPQTRQSVTSPPYSPTAAETREVLDEYKFGLMVRREEPFGQTDHRELWSTFAARLLEIESQCNVRGYPRAFLLAAGNCLFCHHDDRFRPCDYVQKNRPTLEAAGIDLRETLDFVHWGDFLTRGADDPFQMFALLLLE